MICNNNELDSVRLVQGHQPIKHFSYNHIRSNIFVQMRVHFW